MPEALLMTACCLSDHCCRLTAEALTEPGSRRLGVSQGERDVAGEFADDSLGAAVWALIKHRVLYCNVGLLEATHF